MANLISGPEPGRTSENDSNEGVISKMNTWNPYMPSEQPERNLISFGTF